MRIAQSASHSARLLSNHYVHTQFRTSEVEKYESLIYFLKDDPNLSTESKTVTADPQIAKLCYM
jgi:bisphosphoglycerate-independent phosphoglycerate mutase (AlkP superfamily)